MTADAILPEERVVNETAIKTHALACSKKNRAGHFTRVGQDFIDEVLVDVDCLVRNIRNKDQTLHTTVEVEGSGFVTGNLMNSVAEELNKLIGRIIQNKVQRQPTVGCTLRATR
jgi:hypothetical protein